MSIYFVLEGRRTEKKVYNAWMQLFSPHFKRVSKPESATKNDYYLLSAEGYPEIKDEIAPAIKNIKENSNFKYFVIVVDSETASLEERRKEFEGIVKKEQLPEGVSLKIIVQHPCIETWFLGNNVAIPTNPTLPEACECKAFYDVRRNDPELLKKPEKFSGSVAAYHHHFLNYSLKDRSNGVGYSKSHPGQTITRRYWNRLVLRVNNTPHIQSFLQIVDFFDTISQQTR